MLGKGNTPCQEHHIAWHARHQHDYLELHAFLVTSSIPLCCIQKLIRNWEICQPLSEEAEWFSTKTC